uniref:calcium uptake protein 3, mitochondrial isoform X2 n=1 Tax=Ciona intestinalis TaxID=7719 RepID=UPI00006A46AC|nr:calcium uptake protein 3, mitochondrial isoform X2 [Ciona intestinalis]|eukprot:XP_002123358.2 calcium uptake protein 3, mitochondrial isoform X2 [Ciona intestinalis]
MASSRHWRRIFASVTSQTNIKYATAAICTAGGSAIVWKTFRSETEPTNNWLNTRTARAASVETTSTLSKPLAARQVADKPGKENAMQTRENRFRNFASLQMGEDLYMTPQDFLESVSDESPRPRIGQLKLTESDVKRMLGKTPDRNKNSSRFFRSLHNNGLISYAEYLFLLCILTKPISGFQIAFNMFDMDGNQRVDRKEFMVLSEIFRKRSEKSTDGNEFRDNREAKKDFRTLSELRRVVKDDDHTVPDTTLLVHLFGRNGKNDLSYGDFHRFMDNLQTEVLEIEFLEYSRGMATISEVDFARMLLRFTEVADIEENIEKLRERIPEEKGITFEEFRSFFQFLNNLEDFAIAMQMYTLAGRSIGQDEFMRAVQVSTGHKLSEHIVHTLFQIFDKDGDNRLSHVEFIGVMKDRIHRGFRLTMRKCRTTNHYGWSGYKKCIRSQIRNTQESS